MGAELVLCAAAMLAFSGVPGLFARRSSPTGERIAAALMVVASTLGLFGALTALTGELSTVGFAWGLPLGRFEVSIDALSTAFLLPIFLLTSLGSVYGLSYWSQAEHPESGTRLRLFYGLAAASMVLVVIAKDGVLFLLAWEGMALSAFVLVTTEDELASVRRAGWVYLIATHLATLLLFGLFALIHRETGSFALAPIESMELGTLWAVFLLALAGFGIKAGIMPLHVWLPAAHASAPSHVSAIMSGVMIKMGIYGIARVTTLLPDPPWATGVLLLLAGATSAILGVLFAIGQHDIKRLLAYHSVENIGIIVMGLGLALVGRSVGRGDLVALGLAGAVLHTWNHGIFKAMLFFGAGSVVHATGTRELERMGGLGKRMPWTTALFVIGAVAICGLPPLNGFVSELLIYLGLMRPVGDDSALPGLALFVPALALVGALAVACFVKVTGVAFLGSPRSPEAARAHESPPTMLAPMGVLAALCLVIGLGPGLFAPILDRVVAAWAPGGVALTTLVPFAWLSFVGVALLGLVALVFVGLRRSLRAGGTAGTWDCGYAAPTARMQYTASSFAAMLTGLFAGFLRPHVEATAPTGVFPGPARFESHVHDVVLDEVAIPAIQKTERLLARFRFIQQGRLHLYILWILIVLVGLMLWVLPTGDAFDRLFGR